ncbi:glycoside hydrolase family 19 protein [Rhizobacter fulvus]|jgi:predicted chitinase
MLTDAQLQQIMPNLAAAKRALYLPHLDAAMQAHGIDGPLRIAAFVAQLAHESGEFRWMEEIWGPTDAQRRYEPPSDLAKRLGNTQAGDGKRFKGRGPIQITGRFNYEKYGALLGLDLTSDPALAATPGVAFATAGLYWQKNGLNELADVRDFVAITKRINGGTNGLADRQRYYALALGVLGVGAAPREAPLGRGYEAIVADAKAPARRRAASKKTVPAKKVPARKAARPVAAKKAASRRTA